MADKMADQIVIRPVGADERAAWEPLWDGYIAFYKATLAPGASASPTNSSRSSITDTSSHGMNRPLVSARNLARNM